MKTYKFKLYQHKRNKHLHRTINAAGNMYNHCIALHKRYYRLFGKHLNKNRLMKHIAQLRRKNDYWQQSNASVNILRVGASTLRVGDVSQPQVAISV